MIRIFRVATALSVVKRTASYITGTRTCPTLFYSKFSMFSGGRKIKSDCSAGLPDEALTNLIDTRITESAASKGSEEVFSSPSKEINRSSKGMTLRYISDIHLEFYDVTGLLAVMNSIKRMNPLDRPEVLVLAGDIGKAFSQSYSQFLSDMNTKFDKVFVIPGNHEYYERGYTMNESLEHMESVIRPLKNVTFLHRKVEFFSGYYFVGATQWADLTNTDTNKYKINDVRFIKDMSVEKFKALYNEDKEFIFSTLNEIAQHNRNSAAVAAANTDAVPIVNNMEQNVIMITHHLPSYELTHSNYRKLPFDHYSGWFSGSLDDVMKKHDNMIKYWIYGHTHEPSTQMLHFPTNPTGEVRSVNLSRVDLSLADIGPKCVYLCNPLGYPGERRQDGYFLSFNAYVDL